MSGYGYDYKGDHSNSIAYVPNPLPPYDAPKVPHTFANAMREERARREVEKENEQLRQEVAELRMQRALSDKDWSVYHDRVKGEVRRRVKDLGRQYGIASRTIHRLREDLQLAYYRREDGAALRAKEAEIDKLEAEVMSLSSLNAYLRSRNNDLVRRNNDGR